MDTQSLQDSIHSAKVARARAMTPGQRFHAGFELFEIVRKRMLAGIRSEFPEFSQTEVDAEFRRRLQVQRQQREKLVYKVVGTVDHP